MININEHLEATMNSIKRLHAYMQSNSLTEQQAEVDWVAIEDRVRHLLARSLNFNEVMQIILAENYLHHSS